MSVPFEIVIVDREALAKADQDRKDALEKKQHDTLDMIKQSQASPQKFVPFGGSMKPAIDQIREVLAADPDQRRRLSTLRVSDLSELEQATVAKIAESLLSGAPGADLAKYLAEVESALPLGAYQKLMPHVNTLIAA